MNTQVPRHAALDATEALLVALGMNGASYCSGSSIAVLQQ